MSSKQSSTLKGFDQIRGLHNDAEEIGGCGNTISSSTDVGFGCRQSYGTAIRHLYWHGFILLFRFVGETIAVQLIFRLRMLSFDYNFAAKVICR